MRFFDSETRLTMQLYLAIFLAISGIVLLFISFFVDPTGEISASVLKAVGEIFTFSGSVMGIDYHYRTKIYIKNKDREIQFNAREKESESSDEQMG